MIHKSDDYEALFGDDDWTSILLPNGLKFLTSALYSKKESAGVVALVVISIVSLLAVIGLLVAISLSAFNTRSAGAGDHLFVRTQVATYFVCLLLCNIIQSIGSIMSARWVMEKGVYYGDFCRTQGEIKMTADVGTAIWSLFIAAHTFNLLFLQLEMHRFVLIGSTVAGWAIIAAFVVGGPAVVDRVKRGPFYGISGLWCWVSEGYPLPRITNDYLVMFVCGFLCLILYLLVWLRTRGNIVHEKGRWRFQSAPPPSNWRPSDLENNYTKVVAGRMLLYPVAYFVTLFPIAICRFVAWSGRTVPFEATIFSDAVFLMSGLINVLLFVTTRRMLPPRSVVKWTVGGPKLNSTTVKLPNSPTSAEKGTLPGDLGIYLIEEPSLMKTAAYDDDFRIAAQPPTPGAPRSPYALPSPHPGAVSGFEQAQDRSLNNTKPPFTPRPFRLSMNAPLSPAPRSPGWGQPEPQQPFTPRALRLSKGGAASAGPPHSPGGGAPPPSASAWEQEVARSPVAPLTFRLAAVPVGAQRRNSTRSSIGSSLGGVEPSPAAPSAAFEDVPRSAFVAAEDEMTRGRPGFDHHESGAWSPSREEARSRATSQAPSRAHSRTRSPSSERVIGPISANSEDSDYEEPEFEMMH